jgi:putative glutamine amidotransferase
MKRPVIGITVDTHDERPYYECPFAYARSVERAGGLPLLMPYKTDVSLVPQYVDLFDGLLFSGGNDLDPTVWGEARNPKTKPIDPDRERWERALMAEVERRRTPTLAICLGSQLMNVYRGGSMTQFIPDDKPGSLEHRMLDRATENRHPVTVNPESTLGELLGKRDVLANSSHKQCMNKIGRGLRVIATAPDGIVEALEDPTMPLWLGVQWHPERLAVLGEDDHQKLFHLLVDRSRSAR